MLISNDCKLQGMSVYRTTLVELQTLFTAKGQDPYHVKQEMLRNDVIIIDEIDKQQSVNQFYATNIFDLLEQMITRNKNVVLVGNCNGVLRQDTFDNTTGAYANDVFDKDRLSLFNAYEFIGASHRGYRR
jgi:hypothetical protein